VSTSPMRPFLRWAGSKRKLLPRLAAYWQPSCVRYVEPFAGSACLFFRLQPKRAVLADINPELIATYREVRQNVDAVINALATMQSGREEYLRLRSLDPTSVTPCMRAARFIFLNRFCFNGLYRTNLAGRFNVPYGGERTGTLPSPTALRSCSRQLQEVALVRADFGVVLKHARKGDFVYMDPPFVIKSKRIFNEYDPRPFTTADVERLRSWMELLDRKGIPFLVSYAACDESNILQEGFHRETVIVRRNIAGFAGMRSLANEVLISNVERCPQEVRDV
jgi:DNA adenine methylase